MSDPKNETYAEGVERMAREIRESTHITERDLSLTVGRVRDEDVQGAAPRQDPQAAPPTWPESVRQEVLAALRKAGLGFDPSTISVCNEIERIALRAAPPAPSQPLRAMLEKATTRLEILRDRMQGCDGSHEVSLLEVPDWIEEQREALRGGPAPSQEAPPGKLTEILGVHSWTELADACRKVLLHGEEGAAELWGSSLMATAASVFGYLDKLRSPTAEGPPPRIGNFTEHEYVDAGKPDGFFWNPNIRMWMRQSGPCMNCGWQPGDELRGGPPLEPSEEATDALRAAYVEGYEQGARNAPGEDRLPDMALSCWHRSNTRAAAHRCENCGAPGAFYHIASDVELCDSCRGGASPSGQGDPPKGYRPYYCPCEACTKRRAVK